MPRVLMVDTAVLFRMLEESFLRRAGWEIVCAGRGRDVLDRVRAVNPDLVLLDTAAEDLDAPGCLEALRSDARVRAIPVVILADPVETTLCRRAGADVALARPVEPASLESTLCSLARVASRRGARRPVRLTARVETAAGVQRGRVKDISRTGIFLALPRRVPIASTVGLRLNLPASDGSCRVQAHGIVVRHVTEDRGSHLIAGVGVRFTAVDKRSEAFIERFVSLGPPAGAQPEGELIA